MSISTLVLGLGGTGVLAARYLKKRYPEIPEGERVPCEILAIDFDRSNLMIAGDDLAPLDDGEFLFLDPEGIQEAVRNIDRSANGKPAWEQVLEWFPNGGDERFPVSEVEANGAGQFRALGRLGFFLHDQRIEDAMRSALERLGAGVDTERLSRRQRVVLICSVAGGTGAGMMMDIAYLARRQLGRPRVYAYLMLPEVFVGVDHGDRIFQNGYATLKELAYLKNQQIPFTARYEHLAKVEVAAGAEAPFARLFLFSRPSNVEGGAVAGACQSIAEAVLGQLSHTIQEKTLAVVANTAARGSMEEQRRQQTYVFCATGSRFISLTAAETSQASVVNLVLRAIRDPGWRERAFAGELDVILEQLEQRITGEDERLAERPAAGKVTSVKDEHSSREPDDRRAQSLADRWRTRVQRAADDGAVQLLKSLKEKHQHALATLKQRGGGSLERANGETESLGGLLMSPLDEQHYDTNLKRLRELAPFSEIDRGLQEQIRTILRSTAVASDDQERFKRRLLYQKLKDWDHRFRAEFPPATSDNLEAWQDAWKGIDRWEGKKVGAAWEVRTQEESDNLSEGESDPQQAPAVKVKIGLLARFNRWVRRLGPSLTSRKAVLARLELLRRRLEDDSLAESLKAVLKVRAYKTLRGEIAAQLDNIDRELAEAEEPLQELETSYSIQQETASLSPELRERVLTIIRSKLPLLYRRTRELLQREEEPERRKKRLLALVEDEILSDPELREARFVIDEGQEDYEKKILDALVRTRQDVFVRRTPNPRRKGIGLLLMPRGIFWPGGEGKLRSFLEANARQILECRCEPVTYEGSRIWIYYQDLFNPPEHIRLLDEYFERYRDEPRRELFHIDRRFLENPAFKEIHSGSATLVVTCGNPRCRKNIGQIPRTERVCPHCHKMIRSRCGNANCREDHLDQRSAEQRNAKECPSCGGFNHAAWWCCTHHEKGGTAIPIDKERCPECIHAHHRDPDGFPVSRISRRPDLRDSIPCPSCEDLKREDPGHEVFWVRQDLLPFYRDGVNGHDRERFKEIAKKYGLLNNYRCPQCRGFLIPVHHHQQQVRRSEC